MQEEVSKRSLKVVIVESQPQVREELNIILELAGGLEEPPIAVVAEAGSGNEAMRVARSLQPEVVIISIEAPLPDLVMEAGQIKQAFPEIRVIVLSIRSDPKACEQARLFGVDAIIQKGAPVEELISAIRSKPVSHPGRGV